METGMMKVVFSSIINGANGDLSANEPQCDHQKHVTDKPVVFKPDIRYSIPKSNPDCYHEKSSKKVFASLINAASCANLQASKAIDSYLTRTAEGPFVKAYVR